MKTYLYKTLTLIAVNLFICISISAQTNHLQKGISFYEKGEFKSVIKKLKKIKKGNKDFSVAQYYIGLAYEKRNKPNKALKAHNESVIANPTYSKPKTAIAKIFLKYKKYENAVKFAEAAVINDSEDYESYYVLGTAYRKLKNYSLAAKYTDKLIELKPNFAEAYLLKSNTIEFGDDIKEDSAEYSHLLDQKMALRGKYIELLLSSQTKNFNKKDLRALNFFDGYFKQKIASSKNRDKKINERTGIKILSKRKPGYTEEARKTDTQGEVKILVAFLSNGKVGETFFLKRLGSGLDEAALRSAKKIKFIPPTENGKPVTTVRTVLYNFNIIY